MSYEIKNQSELPGFSNDCTVYSCATILELTYWVYLPYEMVEKIAHKAYNEGVLKDWGAVFEVIYTWIAEEASEATWLNIIVDKISSTGSVFQDSVEEGYYYGLWLYMWNNSYLAAVDRWFLDGGDIDDILEEGVKWSHNNVYGFSLDVEWKSIIEVARGKEVYCTMDTLKYWVKKWVFWSPARTFIGWDPFSTKALNYLRQIHFNPDSEIIIESEEDEKAMDKASWINMNFKIKTKNHA